MSRLNTITTTLQQVSFLLFYFALDLALLIIIVIFFYNIGRVLYIIYMHANQQKRAKYRYYTTLALISLFAWNLLLKEQEACASRMAVDVMDCLREKTIHL